MAVKIVKIIFGLLFWMIQISFNPNPQKNKTIVGYRPVSVNQI